jgi:hypothetical protein
MKNKEKKLTFEMVKKAKKRNVSNVSQKNHLLPKCQDLELEFSKES